MSFELPEFTAPDFNSEPFVSSPDASLAKVVREGAAPDNFHATSIYPEFFKIAGKWLPVAGSRMDCVVTVSDGGLQAKEFRRLMPGDRVVVGRREDASDGIYVYPCGFPEKRQDRVIFSFRSGRSRETSYSRDYDRLYELLRYERDNGYIVWVLGPAAAFDQDSRTALAALINNGFAHAVLAGNALAVHDLEGAVFKTALGQNIYNQVSMPEGHYHHLEVINKARSYGNLREYIRAEKIHDGIIHACVERSVPFVLAGSIRDDGPLPGVIGDVYQAQNAMREHTSKATTLIGLATQLHTIAAGNMTPSYQVRNGRFRPVYIYSVDISEFAVNKLRDRGSLEVTTIVANVQDFLVNLARNLADSSLFSAGYAKS